MEIPVIRLSPENFITIALLSAVAYLGVAGGKMLADKIKSKVGGS